MKTNLTSSPDDPLLTIVGILGKGKGKVKSEEAVTLEGGICERSKCVDAK
jgi:hypothetical protein